jgi:hypothetical protein
MMRYQIPHSLEEVAFVIVHMIRANKFSIISERRNQRVLPILLLVWHFGNLWMDARVFSFQKISDL